MIEVQAGVHHRVDVVGGQSFPGEVLEQRTALEMSDARYVHVDLPYGQIHEDPLVPGMYQEGSERQDELLVLEVAGVRRPVHSGEQDVRIVCAETLGEIGDRRCDDGDPGPFGRLRHRDALPGRWGAGGMCGLFGCAWGWCGGVDGSQPLSVAMNSGA
ncbi:hypothetical protein [Streptomyces sp. NPDC052107]|uniref:hypothetical protein n=1 Tax=Streptomyces sp. NPDC052107 TaxID=3155632 RepID=UPI00343AC599